MACIFGNLLCIESYDYDSRVIASRIHLKLTGTNHHTYSVDEIRPKIDICLIFRDYIDSMVILF